MLDEVVSGVVVLSNHASLQCALGQGFSNDKALVYAAYQKWQHDCVQYLRGEFAFVIRDPKNHHVFAACDPMGMRSLYYTCDKRGIRFDTDISSLVEPDCHLSRAYLVEAFSRSLCAEHSYGAHTLYQEIKRLPGGHALSFFDGKLIVERYWHLDTTPVRFEQDQDYVDGFYEKLSQAVRRCVVPNERLALEISGGIDSLAVAAVARQSLPTQNMIAMSNNCPDRFNSAYQFTSEKKYADAACQHLNIQQVNISDKFDCFTQLDQFESVLPGFVEDLFSFMNLAFYQHTQHIGASVLLSGFGGDQVATQHAFLLVQEYRHKQKQVRGFIEWWLLNGSRKGIRKLLTKALCPFHVQPSLPVRYRGFVEWLTPALQQHLQQFVDSQAACMTVQEQEAQYVQGHQFGFLTSRPSFSNLLAQHYGVRHRYPMLDVDLLNYCHNVPVEQKRRWGMGRRLVRKALLPSVPKALILRNDKTSATCPQQIIQLDQTLLAYFKSHSTIPKVVHDYIQWPKLQSMLAKQNILDGSTRRALLYIVQLERLNQRFGFLD